MNALRRTLVVLTALAFVGAAGTVMAGKPVKQEERGLDWSNGFPSGEHFNLNIHGKKDGYQCEPDDGGGSIFVPEYGSSQIDYIQNKKSSVTELTVHDKCGAFDGDPAQVQLPSGEYQVYARILAKPAKDSEPREVVFYPKLVETCDDSGTENFSTAVSCDESFLLGTGVITSGGAYDMDSGSLERVDPTGGKGKGKSTAQDISALFSWSGYACDQSYDTDGDGEIGIGDLSTADADLDGLMDGDLDRDGDIDEADLALFLELSCTWYDSEWVFNIADLVVSGWDYQNSGSKLLQVRFYPTETTTFG